LLVRGIGGGTKDFRFVEDVIWIGSIGAHYHIGVDGISLWLVLLTTALDADSNPLQLDGNTEAPTFLLHVSAALMSAMIGVLFRSTCCCLPLL